MQYPHKITLIYSTPDAYGSMTETKRDTMRCLVIERHKVDVRYNFSGVVNYDMAVVVPAKGFEPYLSLLNDDNLRFEYGDKRYLVSWGSGYNKSSGTTKLYNFKLKEDKEG